MTNPEQRNAKAQSARKHNSMKEKLASAPVFKMDQTAPRPYPRDLAIIPSPLRPHVLCQDRIRLWRPLNKPATPFAISEKDEARVREVLAQAYQPSTAKGYGTGLLLFHAICDEKGVSEAERAPASHELIEFFIAALSGKLAPAPTPLSH